MTKGVLLDIDGVLTSWKALPGALETMQWLHAEGIDIRLVTDTSSKSRGEIAALLAGAGIEIEQASILTAVTGAVRYLAQNHEGVDCFLVNEGDLTKDLGSVELVDARSAGVVLLGGAGTSIGYDELNAVFQLASAGVPIVALHGNVRYQTESGPALERVSFGKLAVSQEFGKLAVSQETDLATGLSHHRNGRSRQDNEVMPHRPVVDVVVVEPGPLIDGGVPS
jgi:ribonucleotide monophosphatase NagD (HAD superfamily)